MGILTTLLTFLGGIWLFLAPFIVGYQDVGQDWLPATKNDLWTGGALIALSAMILVLFSTFLLRDAARAARRRDLEKDRERELREESSINDSTDGASGAV